MGDHNHPLLLEGHCYESTNAGLGSGPYTTDWFVCGLCGLKTCDIESYVTHMVLKEQCVLHLCPSSSIRDLLLPRFSKKRAEAEEVDIKHVKDLVPIMCKEGNEINDVDMKVVQASEIETGNKTRWKCQLCGLTFSRQAAVFNHYKLQHTVAGVMDQQSSVSEAETEDICVKKETSVDSKTPVRHIVAVKSKTHLEQLTDALQYPDTKWNKLNCHLCGQIFKTGKILRTHIAVVHNQGRPFQCNYEGCSQSFKTKGSLTRHERRHTGERPFTCQDCGRCFRESGSLARHQQSRVSCVNKKDSQMPLYGKTRPLDSPYVEKKPLLHDMKLNTILKQEICGHLSDDELPNGLTPWKTDETKSDVTTRLVGTQGVVKQEDNLSHHSALPDTTHTLVPCKVEMPLISSSYTEEEDLDGSLLTPESKGMNSEDLGDIKPPHLTSDIIRKSFTCPVCCKNYSRRPTLALHLNIHLDELGGNCNECGKSFAKREALCRHLTSHSNVRQFMCQLCNKAFKLLSHARVHLRTHTTTKTIPCRYCNNLYKTKSARNMHERTHDKIKAFMCMECQKAFVTKASLIRHLRIHTGEAPFHCQYCGRCFKEHGTLSRHLKHKMPCAQQAAMEMKTGDVGIRLVQGNSKMVKVETSEKSQDGNVQTSQEQKDSQTDYMSSPEPTMSDPTKHYNMEDTVSLSSPLLEDETDLLALGRDQTPSSFQLNIQEHGVKEERKPEDSSHIFLTNNGCGTLQTVDTLTVITDT
ncbi:transcription factor E4F1-like isoform X2 [Homarus americanus]|uniref:transcription factor E4F1-like isoform X2 n=1 Tax=Homarus americanus TaxID=6706 RepID=UPI001C4742E7|nr:transcription factor E4F1-like isoform X2 [Homarus americanus]